MAQVLQLAGNARLQGDSAYEIALKNGFEGTEEEWLASLGGGSGLPDVAESTRIDVLTETDLGTFSFLSDYKAFGRGTSELVLDLSVGDEVTVVWDKTTVCVCTVQDASTVGAGYKALGNASAFGLSGNNEPFAIGFDGNGTTFFSTEDTTAKQHWCEIYKGTPSADEGAFLRAVNGVPAWVVISIAEEASF